MTTLLLLLLLPALAWAQGPDQVSTPPIVFDSDRVSSCAGRKLVLGDVSYCDSGGTIQVIGGAAATTPRCGDGILGNTVGEQCETDASGAMVAGSVCGTIAGCDRATCRCEYPFCTTAAGCPGGAASWDCVNNECVPLCGNGVVAGSETCDPADDAVCPGTIDPDDDGIFTPRCTATCTCLADCGDGILHTDATIPEMCELQTIAGTTFGSALAFSSTVNGTGARYETAGDVASFDFAGNDFVIELLFEYSAANAETGTILIGKNYGVTLGWVLKLLTGGVLRFSAADGGTGEDNATSSALTLGNRYHIAVTRVGTAVAIYALNISANETTHTDITASDTPLTTISNTTSPLSIGGRSSIDDYYLNGVLDDIRIRTGTGVVADYLANRMEQQWNDPSVTCGGANNIIAYWKLDEASGTTAADTCALAGAGLARQGNDTAKVSWQSSPFGQMATTTWTGCSAGESCDPVTCQCGTDVTPTGTFYISPTGDDNAAGATATPWKTFARAFDVTKPVHVGPGMTLKLKNGTYSAAAGTGVIAPVCGAANPFGSTTACTGTGRNAECGTSALPITIDAENAGSAIIVGDGVTPAIWLRNCQYWTLTDLVSRQVDNKNGGQVGNIWVANSYQITLDRIVAKGTNRYWNTAAVLFQNTRSSTARQVEVYDFHRHGLQAANSSDIIFDRCYSNAQGTTLVPCTTAADCAPTSGYASCDASGGGTRACGGTNTREAMSLYPANDSKELNCIVDDGGGEGQTINASSNSFASPASSSGSNNQILGSIVLFGRKGALLQGRCANGTNPCTDVNEMANVTFRDFLAVKTGLDPGGTAISTAYSASLSNSIYIRSTKSITLDNVTAFAADGTLAGLSIDDQPAIPCTGVTGGCTATVTDSLFANNGGTGLNISTNIASTCTLTNVTSTGNGTNLAGRAASGGSQCTGDYTGVNTTALTGSLFGLTGTGCVTHIQAGETCCKGTGTGGTDRGADVRCRYDTTGTKLSGQANNMWAATGSTTCTAAATHHPCKGSFVGCVPWITAGYNDGATACWNVHERLNIKSAGTGCPFAAANLDCP